MAGTGRCAVAVLPEGQRARPAASGLERMLRMYIVQQCFGLSDEGRHRGYDLRQLGDPRLCRHGPDARVGAGRDDAAQVSSSA